MSEVARTEAKPHRAGAGSRTSSNPRQNLVTIIEPRHSWAPIDLRELWAYRGLLYFLVWRDLKVRYKQTVVGAAWAILQPALIAVVFTIFFGILLGVPSEGVPYPVFLFAALLPWQLVSGAVTAASNSLVGNQHLLTKVYFPRLLMPLGAVLGHLVDFLLSLVVLAGLLAYYRIVPPLAALALPAFVFLALATAFALGLWLGALNVRFRDVHHAVPFLLQVWFFATPIFYPVSLVPPRFQALYALNPMVGVVEGFRWCLLGVGQLQATWAASTLVVLMALLGGLVLFRRMERSFADYV